MDHQRFEDEIKNYEIILVNEMEIMKYP